MTCKDCLHYECCHNEIVYGIGSDDLTGKYFTDIETRCKNFINKACFVVFPCNTGDIIKDGTGESYIVDEIRYIKSFLFDGSEKETKKVSLRSKNAKTPIYSATIHSFDEIENILKRQGENNATAFPFADLVEVVRCKDCAIPHNKFTGCPYLNGLVPPENHFCGYGKRKGAAAHGDPIPAADSGEI